jgi:predicted RNA binding protein YcfA (HicA-like mRNA interferase family)
VSRLLKKAIRNAEREGWTVRRTGSGHWQWKSPEGAIHVTASTPRRGEDQLRRSLERMGVAA